MAARMQREDVAPSPVLVDGGALADARLEPLGRWRSAGLVLRTEQTIGLTSTAWKAATIRARSFIGNGSHAIHRRQML
jgi:hypothetical protein